MKDQFVPFELAVKLKELGFDEECFGYSYRDTPDPKSSLNIYFAKQPINNSSLKEDKGIALPLWQQAFDWIRENFNITFWIEPCGGWFQKAYLWEYCIITHDNHFIGRRSEYREEQEALLRRLIDIIEKGEHEE